MPGRAVYARLKPPAGNSTIALHLLAPGETLATGGVRLYFETTDLESFCKTLEAKGAKFPKLPKGSGWSRSQRVLGGEERLKKG